MFPPLGEELQATNDSWERESYLLPVFVRLIIKDKNIVSLRVGYMGSIAEENYLEFVGGVKEEDKVM